MAPKAGPFGWPESAAGESPSLPITGGAHTLNIKMVVKTMVFILSILPVISLLSSVICPLSSDICNLFQVPDHPKPQIQAFVVAVVPVRRSQSTDAGQPPAGIPDDVVLAFGGP